MTLLNTYRQLKDGKITDDDAAKAFGITESDLKFRLTRHGKRLPVILATLDKIAMGQISRDEASEAMSITVRHVNKLMETWHVKRPLAEYHVTRAASVVKWEIRKKFAIDFIAGDTTLLDAAEDAGVTDRQMRRWISDLLFKHYEMPFKDLKLVSSPRRKRLADEIETAEGLEIPKQQVLKSIADGKKSLHDEALERVLSKRSRKGRNVQSRNGSQAGGA